MKAKIAGTGASVYSGTGFSASVVAELAPGDEVEILSTRKGGGKKWLSVVTPDGKAGLMPGSTAFDQESSSHLSDWRKEEFKTARNRLVRGLIFLIGGVSLIAFDFFQVKEAIEQGGGAVLAPKLLILIGIGAVLYGTFQLIGAIVEAIQAGR